MIELSVSLSSLCLYFMWIVNCDDNAIQKKMFSNVKQPFQFVEYRHVN